MEDNNKNENRKWSFPGKYRQKFGYMSITNWFLGRKNHCSKNVNMQMNNLAKRIV